MQVTANLQSLRIAPRKVRVLARLMKGADALAAKQQLRFWAKRSSKPLEKLIDSALANAYNNFGLVQSNMRIKDVVVDGGAVLKRFEPKGFGSVSPLAKRTSHITIILEEKVAGLKAEKREAKKEEHEHDHDHDHKQEKPEVKKAIVPKAKAKTGIRRLFQRKTI